MVGYDGPAPGIEIWPAQPADCDRAISQASFAHSIAMAKRADAHGFDWVSVSEHHYAPYILTPNPCVMAAALAQATTRAKIALLGPLVPLVNPVRLAEELAMVDMISGGRLVVLFLRGTPNEHRTYDSDAAATRAMTQEGIDLIRKAWTEDAAFGWESEHYTFSTVSVWPRTVQAPHPPIYGSGNSEESVRFAAERRMGIAFSFAPVDVVRDWRASSSRPWAAHRSCP
jgi:alkanesulfonate monooxygenase SsuD/methylene tetrahydromethanopterin reductase-like flavin-dependent oxidoreductase (luciferase family)